MVPDQFPGGIEVTNTKAGHLILKPGNYQVDDATSHADYGALIVPVTADGIDLDSYTIRDVVDDSKSVYLPMNFTPRQTFQEVALQLVQTQFSEQRE